MMSLGLSLGWIVDSHSEIPGYRYIAHHNIHVDRADNECFTSAQPPAVVDWDLYQGQHDHELVSASSSKCGELKIVA